MDEKILGEIPQREEVDAVPRYPRTNSRTPANGGSLGSRRRST
jgi:hypothetical protein